ncbi:putative holin-like toxin [Limosilactobacillus fermentum]|uniref:putative holin-like toxin n=1 Tax=Limosilactobacillus fermentum TaxID=1613 RepID=UPI003312FCE9
MTFWPTRRPKNKWPPCTNNKLNPPQERDVPRGCFSISYKRVDVSRKIKGSSRVRKANYWSPFIVLHVFQVLTLMLMFGTFVITLLDYIKKHHK